MATKKPAAKATKSVKASAPVAKKATAGKIVATKGAKKAPVKPVKKAAAPVKKKAAAPAKPIKKAAPAKKAALAKPLRSVKPVKKAAAVKKVATAKKAAPAKKVELKKQMPVNKKTSKTVATKGSPAKKEAPAKKPAPAATKSVAKPAAATKKAPTVSKAVPASKKASSAAKKATPAPAVVAKKAAPVKQAEPAPKPVAKKEPKAKKVPVKPQSAALRAKIAEAQRPVKAGSTVPSPAVRPVVTRSTVREEKKPNVIIAHRRVDTKSKKKDDLGKTMINYQPDYTRSILDQPVENQGPVYRYSDEELNEFKELIGGRLEAARKELNYLQGLITRKDEAGTEDTENRYMNMEDGSGAMEREQLAQLASRQIQFINHLEKALMRIENKTYGICRVTGKLIDKARLRAVPHATLSIEAKKTMSK